MRLRNWCIRRAATGFTLGGLGLSLVLGCDSDDAKGSRRYEAVSFPVDAIVQFLDRQK